MAKRVLLLPALLVAFAGATAARADTTQETMFQDDTLLVYKSSGEVARTMTQLKALGVDRLRIAVYWDLVAPNADSATKPRFSGGGESDPGAYPADNWKRYDTIARLAATHGLALNFDVVGDAPRWARQDIDDDYIRGGYYPSASDFGQFVQAVGTRYSGSYKPTSVRNAGTPLTPTTPASTPVGQAPNEPATPVTGGTPPGLPGVPGSGGAGAPAGGTDGTVASADPLPRVSYWSFWNEPNQAHFLTPQSSTVNGVTVETAARLYRSLVDQGAKGLVASGHLGDTILVGELSPVGHSYKTLKGSLPPMVFLRALYCVDGRLHPLTGRYAAGLGCPTTASARAKFTSAHPVLFNATGFSIHPYTLLRPPNLPTPRDFVGPSDVGRVRGALGRIFAAWHASRPNLPIYNTEFGYESYPPNPFGVPLSIQAAFINESEYIWWRNPVMRSYMQFLLLDSALDGGFKTGLKFSDGRVKPAFAAFRMPLWIPNAHRGRPGTFTIWGCLRPAPNGSRQTAVVQFRPRGASQFHTAAVVAVTSPMNYFQTRMRFTRSGSVRVAWNNLYSRTQTITA